LNDSDESGVFLGLDVGKSAYHGHGLTPAGKQVFDKPLPDTEPRGGGAGPLVQPGRAGPGGSPPDPCLPPAETTGQAASACRHRIGAPTLSTELR
jgi:hypothetical protein